MNIRRLVAQNIRRIRLERRLSQEALAYEAEVNRAHMSAVERGVANPTVDFLEKLARVLKCTVGELTSAEPNAAAPSKNLPRGRNAPRSKPRRGR